MGAKNCVPIMIVQADAHLVSGWLRNTAIPQIGKRPDTILTPGYRSDLLLALGCLCAILDKAAMRKRHNHEFSILVPREVARALCSAVKPYAPRWPLTLPAGIIRVAHASRAAVSKRRGRPILSQDEHSKRLAASFTIDERHRKRLRRRQKVSAAYEAWFREVSERGETILTTSLPSPKI